MTKKPHTIQKLFSPLVIILFAVFLRLVPHPANIAPIAGMALFGGIYLNKRYALIIPLLALFISDIFLGFHASMPFVYTSFFITGCIGLWVRNHKSILSVVGASLACSLIFFLLTNFNYWYAASLYPKTMEGLLTSYRNALPFLRNTLLGDLFYTTVLCGGFELLQRLSVKGAHTK